jgi:hypothetical protein
MMAGVAAHFRNENFADPRDTAYARDTFIHAIVAQMISWIDIVDEYARLVVLKTASDPGRLDRLRDARAIVWIDAMLENMPGDRTVHRAGIYVKKPETLRELTRHTAFPRSGRAIDGNDAMGFFHAKSHTL